MQEELNNKLRLNDKNEINLFGRPDKYDYSKFSNLEEFDWDNDLMNKFSPIAQKLNLSQESLDMLLDIALEMSRKQRSVYEKDDETRRKEEVLGYTKLFSIDNELPSSNTIQMREFMIVANEAYSDFCSPKLKEILEKTGLVYHPELIKLFHKIGELSQEDNLSHYGKPPVEELTPAQILYGTKNS